MSLGAAGALLVDDEGAVHAESSRPVTVRSTIGAGDNLLAGFLAAEGRGQAGADALAEAVAWASVAVRARGSVGRAVTDADRHSVQVHRVPDLGRTLPSTDTENG